MRNEKYAKEGPPGNHGSRAGPPWGKTEKHPCSRSRMAGCRGVPLKGEGHFFVGHPDVVMEL